MDELLITYCPCPNQDSATKLAQTCLERHLVACAQIIPGIRSLYWWDGKIQDEAEVILLLKSTHAQASEIMTLLGSEHPYDCPCIVQQGIATVNNPYLEWLVQQCRN